MSNTLAISVYEQIRADIIKGNLEPGQKLSEDMLSKRYHASRTPVREALRELVRDGLAVSAPHNGALVRQFSIADATQVFDARSCLEGYAARLAAQQQYSQEELASLFALNQEVKQAYADCNILLSNQLETQFHHQIAVLSKNPYLLKYIEQNQRIHAFFLNVGICHRINDMPMEQFAAMSNSHDAILYGILHHEPEMAEWAAKMHTMEAKQFYLDSIKHI